MLRWRSWWLVLAALLSAVPGCPRPGEKAMNDDQTQPSATQTASPPQHDIPAVPIRPAAHTAAPGRAQPAPGGECVRPYVNEQLNSRVTERLPAGEWRIRWQTSIDAGF